MSLEKLSKLEAEAIENKIDAHFNASQLPTSDLNTARWLVCLVHEDLTRFALLDAAKIWHQAHARSQRAELLILLDHYKYALRHALILCAKHLPTTEACGPVPSTDHNYTSALHLLASASEYSDATRAFSSFHANSSELFVCQDTGALQPSLDLRTSQYGTLEFLLATDNGKFSPISLLAILFSGPEFYIPEIESIGTWAPTVREIIKRVKLKRGRPSYRLITNFAQELFDVFNGGETSPPPSWVFPWATMPEAQRYYVALQTISAYHLLSIHFGACNKLEGWGIDQICLAVDADELNRDIVRISKLPADVVASTTEALTLGRNTTTPDPALQPLVPIGCGRLAVLGSVILSSNWPRNMLSLHTRVAENTFNARSAVFEHKMIAELESELPGKFAHHTSIHIPTPGGPEEIDLVLIDHQARSILFSELRWMLQPGDVREVLNRRKVIKAKVDQIRRKVMGARAALLDVLDRLRLPLSNWSINGLVIVEGYGGVPSTDPKSLPVVPRDVFVRTIAGCPDLEHAHAALCTPLWLPREGTDFVTSWDVKPICGLSFKCLGAGVGSRSYTQESLDIYLMEAFSRSIDDLRAMPWEAGTLIEAEASESIIGPQDPTDF